MSLTLVATPIGNFQDLTLRGLEVLKSADMIIVEERKESTQVLRAHGITGKTYLELNEHTTREELTELAAHCETKNVALITDCGTPGFCDPGADLVRACREKKIAITSVPGASSLMTLLSLSGMRLDQFVFRGFLPAENESREKAYREIQKEKRAMIIMDTPYRFQKMLSEVAIHFADRRVLVGCDLTQATESVFDGRGKDLPGVSFAKKSEFLILIYPES